MNLPNRLTVLRIILVPVFACCLIYWSPERNLQKAAAILFTAACLTDALDGLLSRRLGLRTRLGEFLDPLADKMLLVTAFLGLAFLGNIPPHARIPAWLTIAVLSRDIVLITGALVIHAVQGKFVPRTIFLGKMTTFFQMALILAALWNVNFGSRPALEITAGALTVASGLIYLRLGGQMVSANGG